MNNLSERGKAVWRLYLWLHGAFAFLYGAFASYSFLYLAVQVRLAGGLNYLPTSMLPFMAGTLLLESIASPFAGAFADLTGRKRSVRVGLTILALAYLCFGALPFLRLLPNPSSPSMNVVSVGLLAIALMTVAVAFFSNALDAWFVDEVQGNPALRNVGVMRLDLHPIFARQSRVFGFWLLVGGGLALLAGKDLAVSARHETLPGLSLGTGVWFGAALAVLWISLRIASRLPETKPSLSAKAETKLTSWKTRQAGLLKTGTRPARPTLRARLAEIFRTRELMRALVMASAVYLCALAVIYLLPQLLHEKSLDQSNRLAAWLVEHPGIFYLASGLTRIIGPMLALRSGPRRPVFDPGPLGALLGKGHAFRKRQAWYWGGLAFGGVVAAGVAFLVAPADWFWAPIALVVLAKLAIEAFKPVQAAFLNELVPNSASRTLAISLATPVGSGVLGACALLLISLPGATAGNLPFEQLAFAVPVLFCGFGLVALLVLRAITRPARMLPTTTTTWRERREKIRAEMRAEEEGMMSSSDEPFMRPFGAGDEPLLRPGVIRAGRRSVRVKKPEYLVALSRPTPAPTTAGEPPAAPPSRPGLTTAKGRAHLRVVPTVDESQSESGQ